MSAVLFNAFPLAIRRTCLASSGPIGDDTPFARKTVDASLRVSTSLSAVEETSSSSSHNFACQKREGEGVAPETPFLHDAPC